MNSPTARQSFITCKNSQGETLRGTLMHLSGQSAVFEVYNPFSILQLSEALQNFQVVIGDRTLYTGRAVVSSLMNTSIMLVAQVTLVDPWADVDIFSILEDRKQVRREVESFVQAWSVRDKLLPEFKLLISDFQSFLFDLNIWLKQVEVGIESFEVSGATERRLELVQNVAEPLLSVSFGFLDRLESMAENLAPEMEPSHKAFTKRELHPLLLCAPFVHRSFSKPLGYAGDYKMINMILSDSRKGESLFAMTVNSVMLQLAPAEAHRNRIRILTDLLIQESERVSGSQKELRVLNVACGPAQEVRDFIVESHYADHCVMTLLDFSPEALMFAEHETVLEKERVGSKIQLRIVEKSVDTLLKEALVGNHNQMWGEQQFDFVYCAGLFDYLTDPVCTRLIDMYHQWTAPGGLVSVTNIHPTNTARCLMEYLMDWNVFHRDEAHLLRLALVEGEKEVIADDTGVNIFLNIRKPE